MAETKTLAELNTANFERAKVDRHLAFTTYPELHWPILLRPYTVRILMVIDAGGSFTDADFGLTELLDVLSISPGPYVRFAVTKAHRGPVGDFNTAGADLVGFRYNAIGLHSFDQISDDRGRPRGRYSAVLGGTEVDFGVHGRRWRRIRDRRS